MSTISRRDALKRGVLAGGALVWATPVVQTVGMSSAFAIETSPPCVDKRYFRARAEWDDGPGAFVWEDNPGFGAGDCEECLDPDGNPPAGVNGGDFGLVIGNVVLDQNGEPDTADVFMDGNCDITAAWTKEAGDCHEGVVTDDWLSAKVGNPGMPAISHIEVCFWCCFD